MSVPTPADSSGFVLKRQGQYDAALQWYVQEYAMSQKKSLLYIQELCFQEIMDILLIKFFQSGKQFHNVNEIVDAVASAIKDLLIGVDAWRDEECERFLADGRQTLLSRRRKGRFSVDKDWLIAKKASKTERKAG